MSNRAEANIVVEIGRCGYAEPDDEKGSVPCSHPGKKILVRDALSERLCVIVRCRRHSDWVEAKP